MTETDFWKLIREANMTSPKMGEVPDYLRARLSELELAEIINFGTHLALALDRAHDGRLWAAAAIVCGGLGDDGFVYFKCWLIAQGENVFNSVLSDPDLMADLPCFTGTPNRINAQMEELLYVSSAAFKARTNGMTAQEYKLVHPHWRPPQNIQPVFSGLKNREFLNLGPEQLRSIFPKLILRFGLN